MRWAAEIPSKTARPEMIELCLLLSSLTRNHTRDRLMSLLHASGSRLDRIDICSQVFPVRPLAFVGA
jgi:hypothetical protein